MSYMTWNIRTGYHAHNEGDVWEVYDGNVLKARYKLVRGKPVPATKKEYEQFVTLSLARQGYTHHAASIVKHSSDYPSEYVEEALTMLEQSQHQEYRDVAHWHRTAIELDA